MIYEIRVENGLDQYWSQWFEGMQISHDDGGVTVLSGRLADQADLHGVLTRVNNLGLALVSVQRLDGDGRDR